ncbi:MAG: matrixin family metalloprotease [Candidatus Omnitrophota bacterium]
MSKKLLCLAVVVVVVGTIFVSAYLASAAPQGKGNDRVLSKVKFIHYRKGYGKPEGTPGGGKGKDRDEGYYTYLAKGAKWKTLEDFYLNPVNEDKVQQNMVESAVNGGMDEWELYAPSEIFDGVSINKNVNYNDGEYRGYNTISFGSHDNSNVIAEASVWGYFGGPPSQREIVEAHILLNDYFEWGDATVDGGSNLMDVQNLVTHELGHCAGMGDLYKTEATEETMYGYSTEGEITKRDLYKGDINGITKLYK